MEKLDPSQISHNSVMVDNRPIEPVPLITDDVPESLIATLRKIQSKLVDQSQLQDFTNHRVSGTAIFLPQGTIQANNKRYNLQCFSPSFIKNTHSINDLICDFALARLAHIQTDVNTGLQYTHIICFWTRIDTESKSKLYIPRRLLAITLKSILQFICNSDNVQHKLMSNAGAHGKNENHLDMMRKFVNLEDIYIQQFNNQNDNSELKEQNLFLMSKDGVFIKNEFIKQLNLSAEAVLADPIRFQGSPTVNRLLQPIERRQALATVTYTSELIYDFVQFIYNMVLNNLDTLIKFKDEDDHSAQLAEFKSIFEQASTQQYYLNQYTELTAQNKMLQQLQILIKKFHTDGQWIHPHINARLLQGANASTIMQYGIVEMLEFDPSYICQTMLYAYWFRMVMLAKKQEVSNNNATLCLYGEAGAGKTKFSTTFLQPIVQLFKWKVGSQFQAPSVMDAQCICLEDIQIAALLKTNTEFKELLDFEHTVKADIKFGHHINVSKHTPCIITTNNNVYEELQADNSENAQALRRRLFSIPFYNGKFVELHQGSGTAFKYTPEAYLNTIFAMALYINHDSKPSIIVDNELIPYYFEITKSFRQTAFGKFFISTQPALKKKFDMYAESMTQLQNTAGQMKQLFDGFVFSFKTSLNSFTTRLVDKCNTIVDKDDVIDSLTEMYRQEYMLMLKFRNIISQAFNDYDDHSNPKSQLTYGLNVLIQQKAEEKELLNDFLFDEEISSQSNDLSSLQPSGVKNLNRKQDDALEMILRSNEKLDLNIQFIHDTPNPNIGHQQNEEAKSSVARNLFGTGSKRPRNNSDDGGIGESGNTYLKRAHNEFKQIIDIDSIFAGDGTFRQDGDHTPTSSQDNERRQEEFDEMNRKD